MRSKMLKKANRKKADLGGRIFKTNKLVVMRNRLFYRLEICSLFSLKNAETEAKRCIFDGSNQYK